MKTSQGFTLVEVLIVMGLLSVIGIMILTIFTSTLRGGNKSQIISVIKQNGAAVTEIIDKTIRNSDKVVCISTNGDTLVVIKNGEYSRFKFYSPTESANGKLQLDFPIQPEDPAIPKAKIEVFLDNVCTDPQGTDSVITPQVLTDTNLITGISIQNGKFTKNISPGFNDTVTVQFEVTPPLQAPSAIAGQIDPQVFQTTIQLR